MITTFFPVTVLSEKGHTNKLDRGGTGILCPKPQSPKDKLGDLKFDTFNGDFGVECFVVEKQVTKSTFFLSNGT